MNHATHPAYGGLYAPPHDPESPAFFPEKVSRADSAHLDALEAQSIFLLREAFHHFKNICMPWSMGKDSNVLIWLAKKAFCGHIPFPAPAHRHDLRVPRDAGIPRLGGGALRAQSHREDQRGRARRPRGLRRARAHRLRDDATRSRSRTS